MSAPVETETRSVKNVALLGRDYRGVSFEMMRAEGDVVQAGEALMRDARRPEIRFAAPAGGRVVDIERGARRKLISIKIEIDADADAVRYAPPHDNEAETLRAFMLESGAWASLRTRPFGNIPHPGAQPAAIFVTALDTQPGAPEPAPLIDSFADEFRAALDLLAGISSAPLYLCLAPGQSQVVGEASNVRPVAFDGGAEAGLPGMHIHKLCPIGFAGGEVWHLGYQEVIALGHLLLRGSVWSQRLIALGGSAVSNPRNLLVPAGAAIDELLRGEVQDKPLRLYAGSAIYGAALASSGEFLAAGQRQITADVDAADARPASATAGVIIPLERLERLAPPGIYAIPLLRALQLGDAERARELGALELVEEDVAPLSHACLSNSNYGQLLREVLDQLEVGR